MAHRLLSFPRTLHATPCNSLPWDQVNSGKILGGPTKLPRSQTWGQAEGTQAGRIIQETHTAGMQAEPAAGSAQVNTLAPLNRMLIAEREGAGWSLRRVLAAARKGTDPLPNLLCREPGYDLGCKAVLMSKVLLGSHRNPLCP